MNIVIIYNDSFPVGKACSNRVKYFAKGLQEAGNNLKVLIHRPTELYGYKPLNTNINGSFDGIDYFYTCNTTMRSKHFINRRFHDLQGFTKSGFYFIRNSKKIDAILFVSGGLIQTLFYKIITKLTGIVYLHQKGELPFIYKSFGKIGKLYADWYVNNMYKLFDGLIIISDNLYDYFKTKISDKTKTIIMPILADSNEFHINNNVPKSNPFTILYAGTLCQKKDGVLNLIRSIKLVDNKGYKVKLLIVGDTQNESDRNKILKLIDELELNSVIKLTGYLPREEYVELLSSADLLTLAKPKSIESEYCFPTKLGEYLLTGKPVLTTDTGVISNYIKEEWNGFLAEPDNIEMFAQKIIWIIENYEDALLAGSKGREIAKNIFDYKINGTKLSEFITCIVDNKSEQPKNSIQYK